jgi:hypothetical protein
MVPAQRKIWTEAVLGIYLMGDGCLGSFDISWVESAGFKLAAGSVAVRVPIYL